MKKDGELIVMKSNELIQKFKFTLSKMELRIVNYLIANINSPLYDEEFNTMTFDISDFYKAMGIENATGSTYNYIKNIIYGLKHKDSGWVDMGDYETIVSWIEKPKIHKKSGQIEIKLDDDLKPYLLKMNGFIQARMNYYYQMNSKYSMRLYELLKSWEGRKTVRFEVIELRASIDAMKKSYDNFGMLKLKVINPSVEEINEITDINISYKEIKRGRKVTHLEFTIDKIKNPEKILIDTVAKEKKVVNETITVQKTTKDVAAIFREKVNEEAFNNEFTDAQVEYLMEIGRKPAMAHTNYGTAEEMNDGKVAYYHRMYLLMNMSCDSKEQKPRVKYLAKMLMADLADLEGYVQVKGKNTWQEKPDKQKFNNFERREYNFEELEAKLLDL